jgi:HAD superfamily hydrolase (TIGR01509 family)
MTLPAAVLFDMDGLLVDTEPVWTIAEVELAHRLGGEFTPELKATIVGTRLEVAVPTILSWYGGPTDDATVATTSAWVLDRMVELFAERPLVLPGVGDLLAALAEAGVATALVSSSYRVLVDAVLSHGFGPFDLTLAGDEVLHAKPHPEPYLTAAARLGVDPRRCVVLEDSPAGVASAEAAGCAVVAVPSVAGVAFEPGVQRLVLTSLAELGLDDLRTLLAA